MVPELHLRKRMLTRCYRRFLAADLAWQRAAAEAAAWFPAPSHSRHMALGNPGSRVRRLYEVRARAVAQLQVARDKLQIAQRRLARRSAQPVLVLRLARAP